ncbi:MAG: polynucleotide adenylyltransferase PcnB [Kiritimatiellae bacterium]|nr:polynucleotide adenylyltransferase PcnB [Kiritimatiellia bacterium]
MFEFLVKKFAKPRKPVICERAQHCISRKNIDPDALKVLYRLSKLGYTAYLVGGGVRDLLLGRKPKDFDVGTNATPKEVKRAFCNCFLIGRRFRLAHIKYGQNIIETATFRKNSQTVGEIIEHAAEGPFDDNTWGTPETDAFRRDFTINGLFYDINTFAVIDYVGGLDDLKSHLIRSIGDPMIRFREDPVRMMRAIRFACKLGFEVEKGTWKAMLRLHGCILSASVPRLCEEVYRFFGLGASEMAFRMAWKCGMLGDLLPELAAFIDMDGRNSSEVWKYLRALDEFEKSDRVQRGPEFNAVRSAVLLLPLARATTPVDAMKMMQRQLKIPKVSYFEALSLLESAKTFARMPGKNAKRYLGRRDTALYMIFNEIAAKAEGRGNDAVAEAWRSLASKSSDSGTNDAVRPPKLPRRRNNHEQENQN